MGKTTATSENALTALDQQTKAQEARTDALAAHDFARAQTLRKRLGAHYREEEKVEIYLSPTYQPYFGKIMPVCVNGIWIYMPVDGRTYKIPKTFADVIIKRRLDIDAIMTKTRRMADVQNNYESYKGELKLF